MTAPRRLGILALLLLAVHGGFPVASAEDDYPKLAPFTGVRWEGDVPEIQVDGAWWGLLAIDGKAIGPILEGAKTRHGVKWKKRFAEDLVQVLSEAGSPPGATVDLLLTDLTTKQEMLKKDAKMTRQNRSSVVRNSRTHEPDPSVPLPPPPGTVERVRREHAKETPEALRSLAKRTTGGDDRRLSAPDAAEDLDELEWLVENRYAYATRRGLDYRAAFDAVRAGLGDGIERGAFAVQLTKLLARFGDGHTRVEESEKKILSPGWLPFLVESVGDRYVAFRADRSDFHTADTPYLISLDGVPIAKWVEAASERVASASPTFVSRHAARGLRSLASLRQELGLPAKEIVTVVVAASASGTGRKLLHDAPIAANRPVYGTWPRTTTRMLDGGIGYLRIAEMEGDPAFSQALLRDLDGLAKAKGIVIDVRGNGGGSREVVRRLLPRFLPAGSAPRVVNVAAYRLGPGEKADEPEGYLSDRFLWPATASVWSDAERKAIAEFSKSWKPEWAPPEGKFSAWHYFVISPAAKAAELPPPPKVVVLLDGGCFSATDIFLAAFQGVPGVTLLGTPSGGGSGRARGAKLAHSGIEVQLSSMASFRADGRLYDGRSIEPDVVVEPDPGYFVGRSDPALDAAVARLR